ncbi:unnamed protein product, partial [Callosobruchus maculatus]
PNPNLNINVRSYKIQNKNRKPVENGTVVIKLLKNMALIGSTTYLAIFSAGTFIGAASAYFLIRFRHRPKNEIWKNGMEERYEFEDPRDEYRLIMAIRNDLKCRKGRQRLSVDMQL